MEVPEKKYPVDAKDYKLYEEIGEGVSATVYRALCIPFNEVVAIKVLDLERCGSDLDGIRREVHTMSLIDNPNALRSHCSFTDRHHLWLVMPYMAGGSCLHIMKFSYPEGFDESVIATLLRETLKALVYLHAHGHIHRDVKAGNILLDSNGAVKLADFGVSACMFDSGDRQRSRNTFVGTPCWMAPEVMQQLHGYDFKADIWSLGITALELAHGHAPFSKYPPMKVLLMTLQNAPPGLDYERDKRFSKSFKELVSACLVKDPKKRPTSEKLLKHHFFKQAKSSDYLARSILDGLPPLGERFRILKAKEAELLVQNKALYGDKDQLSQQEYIRGISAWNFNLDDLKNQAALIQDDDGSSTMKIPEEDVKEKNPSDDYTSPTEKRSPERANSSNTSDCHEDGFDDLDSLEDSLASFPIQPLQALKGCFDVGKDVITNANWKNVAEKNTDSRTPISESKQVGRTESDNLVRSSSVPQFGMTGQKKGVSGPLLHEHIGYPKKNCGDGDRYPCDRNYSGPILLRQKRETNNQTSVDDSSEGAVFQRKGRFQVTSADMYSKGSTSGYLNPFPGSAGAPLPPSSAASAILPSLQCILQHNNVQRDEIVRMIKLVEQGNLSDLGDSATNGVPQIQPLSSREVELLAQVSQLQQRVGSLVEELQRQKLKNAQFEGRLNTSAKKNEKAKA